MSVALGSSPLARGPRNIEPSPPHPAGLIPARAGTTAVAVGDDAPVPAHPRSRGDHSHELHQLCVARGSSPLARGPPRIGFLHRVKMGLIPARAGTTCPPRVGWYSRRAHPRSRGDHCTITPPPPRIPGSSPLARGPHVAALSHVGVAGLIPARAGTTLGRGGLSSHLGAHPRSRGDHHIQTDNAFFGSGSSPLARGPPRWLRGRPPARGLIPARAGTTRSLGALAW